MPRYCLTLDLRKEPKLIEEYEKHHQKIPSAIEKSIKDSGIHNMEIYRFDTRMMMIIDAEEGFSFERKTKMDACNPEVLVWEEMMNKFQKPLKKAKEGEKWTLMKKIFQL